jgi:hypothetical protein
MTPEKDNGLDPTASMPRQESAHHVNEPLLLDRDRLRTGKYTRWAANLTEEQVYGLFWLLGEFGIRTHPASLPDAITEPGRARTGLLGALGFVHGRPLTQEEAMAAIRNAFQTHTSDQLQDSSSRD